jgi:hypothetical protein
VIFNIFFYFHFERGLFIFLLRLNHLETPTTIKRKQTRKNPRITEFLQWAGGGEGAWLKSSKIWHLRDLINNPGTNLAGVDLYLG